MINYIEKGFGLHVEIESAGHWLREVDGVWQASDDKAVQAIIDTYEPQPDKLEGIEFDGVMCSATGDDQAGLTALAETLKWVEVVNFRFENGNTLSVTRDTYPKLMAVWVPFRQGFFQGPRP